MFKTFAEKTGLEPAIFDVTGRRFNQIKLHFQKKIKMKSLTYFHINNVKFNYVLEFQSNHKKDYWKHNAPLIEYCETISVLIYHIIVITKICLYQETAECV